MQRRDNTVLFSQIEQYCIESEFNNSTTYVKIIDIIKLNAAVWLSLNVGDTWRITIELQIPATNNV